jgi:hypothetical protein
MLGHSVEKNKIVYYRSKSVPVWQGTEYNFENLGETQDICSWSAEQVMYICLYQLLFSISLILIKAHLVFHINHKLNSHVDFQRDHFRKNSRIDKKNERNELI